MALVFRLKRVWKITWLSADAIVLHIRHHDYSSCGSNNVGVGREVEDNKILNIITIEIFIIQICFFVLLKWNDELLK